MSSPGTMTHQQAQALLKKRVGDTVIVTGADASRELTVEAIDYGCKQQE